MSKIKDNLLDEQRTDMEDKLTYAEEVSSLPNGNTETSTLPQTETYSEDLETDTDDRMDVQSLLQRKVSDKFEAMAQQYRVIKLLNVLRYADHDHDDGCTCQHNIALLEEYNETKLKPLIWN